LIFGSTKKPKMTKKVHTVKKCSPLITHIIKQRIMR